MRKFKIEYGDREPLPEVGDTFISNTGTSYIIIACHCHEGYWPKRKGCGAHLQFNGQDTNRLCFEDRYGHYRWVENGTLIKKGPEQLSFDFGETNDY